MPMHRAIFQANSTPCPRPYRPLPSTYHMPTYMPSSPHQAPYHHVVRTPSPRSSQPHRQQHCSPSHHSIAVQCIRVALQSLLCCDIASTRSEHTATPHAPRRTTTWYALQAHDHIRATGSPLSSFEATMQLYVAHLTSHTASSTHMPHPRYLSSATSLRAPASYHHLIRTAGLPCHYSQD